MMDDCICLPPLCPMHGQPIDARKLQTALAEITALRHASTLLLEAANRLSRARCPYCGHSHLTRDSNPGCQLMHSASLVRLALEGGG